MEFAASNFSTNHKPPKDLPWEVQSELKRFWLALKTYAESYKPLIPIDHLINGLEEGPSYITFLKKLRGYHTVASRGGRFEEDDPELESVKAYASTLDKVEDIGQIFNVRYYFFWSQPDDEDWQYCFIEYEPILPEDLSMLEETVFQILPDDIPEIYEEEILLQVTGSASRTKDGKASKVFVEKQTVNHFTVEPLEGYGTFIQKCPGDTRFSITLSTPHSNTVKLIEKQVALIAADTAFSCYTNDDEEYFKRYDSFGKKYTTFYNRDLKKDGLTKVRPLIQTVCKAIRRKYPNFAACKYFDIYNDFFIHINGERKNPPRGVGLGMSSALTTILQSALFQIAWMETVSNMEHVGTAGAIIYHDDISIGTDCSATMEEYIDVEDRVMARFRQIKNKKKSHLDDWYVLCENYSDEILDQKDHYQRYILSQPYVAANITHAKQLFGMNLRFIHTVDWKPYLDGLISHFGYEYYPDESAAPAQWGGWVPAYYMSVDISLFLREPNRIEKAAALSYTYERPNAYKMLKKYSKEEYKSPVHQIYGTGLKIPEAKDIYMVEKSVRDVARSYMKMNQIGSKTGFWKNLYKKRQERFNQNMLTPDTDIAEFYSKYLELHPEDDILPPRSLLITEDMSNYEDASHLYRPANPYVQYLKFHNSEMLSSKIIPWPVPPGASGGKKLQLTAEERVQVQYSPTLLKAYNLGELTLLKVNPKLIVSCSWFNVTQVRAAMVALTNSDCLPVIPERKKLSFMKDIDIRHYRSLCSADGNLIETLASRLGSQNALGIGSHIETFLEFVVPFAETRMRATEALKAMEFRLDHEKSEYSAQFSQASYISQQLELSESPLSDTGYFAWKYSHKRYKDWRNGYFWSIEEKIFAFSGENDTDFMLHGMDYLNKEKKYDESMRFNAVESYLYKRSGGHLDEDDLPILAIKAIDVFMDEEDASDDEGNLDPGADPWGYGW